jgi:peptide chain release factor 2
MSWSVFDLPKKQREADTLEEQAAAPGLWDDPRAAQEHMRKLAQVKEHIEAWQGMERAILSSHELVELAIAEEDGGESMRPEVEEELARLEERLERMETELLLSGEYDEHGAILAIHAGVGGTESQDWAQMLLNMYLRFADRWGYKATVLDESLGEEAGVKRVHVEMQGPHAYGYLKGEAGVHRLIRLSPFDSQHQRHTSFALVEVLPDIENDAEVEIDPNDLRIDVYKSSGAGGQNVQKNSTAVRLVHIPTGLIVTCQNERSQHQNRETAMKILRSRLIERKLEEQAKETARLKGQHVEAGWGNQIRTYVLHPYQQVRDHRTGLERTDPDNVLLGDLDDLLEAYLKSLHAQTA